MADAKLTALQVHTIECMDSWARDRGLTTWSALLEALEEARRGLAWYQDAHPESRDGSDDEANERIDAAIVGAGGATP